MYQQTNDNQKFSSVLDIILVIAILVIIVFIKKITGFFSAHDLGILNFVLFAGIVVFCLYVYTQRLCSYRYTLYYKQPEGEDQFGEPYTHPYPLGTILFERMTANKGRLYEGVATEQFVELVSPGEQPTEKINFFNYAKLTVHPKKTAHTLVFKRKGKLWGIYFHPTEEFIAHMKESPLYNHE